MATLPVTRRKSQRQEKQVAKTMGGRVVTASGALPSHKGDVRTDRYLVECKITDSKGFRLTKDIWDKIEFEAQKKGKEPVVVLEMQGKQLAVVDYQYFLATQFQGDT